MACCRRFSRLLTPAAQSSPEIIQWGILAKLATLKPYRRDSIALLIEQLMSCPPNRFPMYVEMTAPVIEADNRERFRKVVEKLADEMERESAKKRVAKVLKKLG